MDLSQFSTDDLQALKAGDLSKVSTQGLQMLKQQQIHDAAAADTAAFNATLDPTAGMSTLDKFNAGAGKAFSDLALGVRERLGLASRDEVKQQRALDAPLMRTGAGLAGNIGGNVAMLAPAAMIPGVSTVPAAATIGGIIGYLQPSASAREDVTNTGLGAAGGALGQYTANLAGNAATAQQAANTATTARNAQKTDAAARATQAGYVVPPEDVGEGGGLVTRILQGVGGKVKTAQVASDRNQAVTDRLVRQTLGMAPDAPMTVQDLAAIRNQAAQAGYAPVRGAGMVTTDPQFANDLNNIVGSYQGAARSFPGLPDNGVTDLVTAVRQPQFDAGDAVDAIRVLRRAADAAFANRNPDLGNGARQAADAIEGMLDRHLSAAGSPDALQAFRDARQLIAQTYSVQNGLNTTTGNVAASSLAKQLQQGRPTGDLRTIAETAKAFPRATQALKEAPKTLSPLDMALAVVQRDPMALLTLGARPAARSILLSQPMQRAAIEAASTPQPPNVMLQLLSNDELMRPVGISAGNQLARTLAN